MLPNETPQVEYEILGESWLPTDQSTGYGRLQFPHREETLESGGQIIPEMQEFPQLR